MTHFNLAVSCVELSAIRQPFQLCWSGCTYCESLLPERGESFLLKKLLRIFRVLPWRPIPETGFIRAMLDDFSHELVMG
jgi:hypothetical protein